MEITHLLIIVGWLFTFYLANRTLRRTETSKIKDSVQTLISQYYQELCQVNSKTIDVDLEYEEYVAQFTSRIEFKLIQINKFLGISVFESTELLSWLRNIGEGSSIDTRHVRAQLIELSSEVDLYFSRAAFPERSFIYYKSLIFRLSRDFLFPILTVFALLYVTQTLITWWLNYLTGT